MLNGNRCCFAPCIVLTSFMFFHLPSFNCSRAAQFINVTLRSLLAFSYFFLSRQGPPAPFLPRRPVGFQVTAVQNCQFKCWTETVHENKMFLHNAIHCSHCTSSDLTKDPKGGYEVMGCQLLMIPHLRLQESTVKLNDYMKCAQ